MGSALTPSVMKLTSENDLITATSTFIIVLSVNGRWMRKRAREPASSVMTRASCAVGSSRATRASDFSIVSPISTTNHR